MADKRLNANTGEPSTLFLGQVVDGLFKWADATASVIGDAVQLVADGPPITVGKSAAVADNIGVVRSVAAQNELVTVLTKFTAVISMTAGGVIARGAYVKTDATGQVVEMVAGDFATGATFGAKFGQALQVGAATDIIYVGLGG